MIAVSTSPNKQRLAAFKARLMSLTAGQSIWIEPGEYPNNQSRIFRATKSLYPALFSCRTHGDRTLIVRVS